MTDASRARAVRSVSRVRAAIRDSFKCKAIGYRTLMKVSLSWVVGDECSLRSRYQPNDHWLTCTGIVRRLWGSGVGGRVVPRLVHLQ